MDVVILGILAFLPPPGPVPHLERVGAEVRRFTSSSEAAPYFAFATSSGVGMTAACACTSPTGTAGEVMTISRGSSAYCSKAGLDKTGIEVGDLVSCGNALPRIMPGTRGGTLGVMVENTATNQATYSEDFTHASWADFALGAAAPTRAADQGTSPANTATADRITFPATTSGQYTMLAKTPAAGTETFSFYIKGVSGSGSIRICRRAGAPWVSETCSFNNTTWTRCVSGSTTSLSVIYLGNSSTVATCGASTDAMAEADVYVWGAQTEDNALGYATTYVPALAGSAGSRSADVISFQTGISTAVGSFAVSVAPSWATVADRPKVSPARYILTRQSTNEDTAASVASTALENHCAAGTTGAGATDVYANVARSSATSRVSCFFDFGNVPVIGGAVDGSSMSIVDPTGASARTAVTKFYIGSGSGTGEQIDAVVYNVCVDPVITRCQ